MDRKQQLQLLAESARRKKKQKGLIHAIGEEDEEIDESSQEIYDENGELLPCYGNDFIVADDDEGDDYVENYNHKDEVKKRKIRKVLETRGIPSTNISLSNVEEFLQDLEPVKKESPVSKPVQKTKKEDLSFFKQFNGYLFDEIHNVDPPRETKSREQNQLEKPSTAFYINVLIEDTKLAIPCKGSESSNSKITTIGDLIREIDTRFSNTRGHNVEITRLETREGSVLDQSDQIAGLLGHGQEVIAITSDKELNNFGVLYKRTCVKKQITINQRIHDRFKKSVSIDTQQLDFSACRVCREDVLAISIAIQQFTGITHLNLNDKSVDELNKTVRLVSGLQVLDLSSNEINKWNTILDTIADLQGLQELNLSYNFLRDTSASAIEKILKNCTQLASLSLSGCQIGILGLFYLSRGLPQSSIMQLNLSDNTFISNEDDISRLQTIAEFMTKSQLKKIDLTNTGLRSVEFIETLISRPSKIRSLLLSRNLLGKESIRAIGDHLQTSQIEILGLEHVGMTAEQAIYICKNLPLSKIARISLAGNRDINKVIGSIAEAIQSTFAIRDVDLSSLGITKEDFSYLLSVLSKPNMLQRLNISNNNILFTEGNVREIIRFIQEIPSLTKLEMIGNKFERDGDWDFIKSSWENVHISEDQNGIIWM